MFTKMTWETKNKMEDGMFFFPKRFLFVSTGTPKAMVITFFSFHKSISQEKSPIEIS